MSSSDSSYRLCFPVCNSKDICLKSLTSQKSRHPEAESHFFFFFVMQAMALAIEDGKDSTQRSQHKAFPLRTLKSFIPFFALVAGLLILSFYTTRRYFYDAPTAALQVRATLRPCPDEQSGLGRWVRPPAGPMHGMSDEELFWVASLAPQLEKYPFERAPKVAFMFLTRGPLPLAPLWEKFFKGGEGLYSIYVHSLPTYKADFPASSVFFQKQIPSQVSEWGKMSMCDAEKRLLANALLDISNERFVLLSESCIPLYNFSIVYQYLMRSQYSFVGAFDDPTSHGRGRYNWHMIPEVNISQWRKGSQWFEVNRKLAISIISDTKYYPKFKEFCKPSCYVDEHYFPTMLSIESPDLIANRSITWVDWSRGGAHPATFGKPDVTETFLRRILDNKTCLYNNQNSSVCFLFARKFAPSALEPLLQLAPSLLGFG